MIVWARFNGIRSAFCGQDFCNTDTMLMPGSKLTFGFVSMYLKDFVDAWPSHFAIPAYWLTLSQDFAPLSNRPAGMMSSSRTQWPTTRVWVCASNGCLPTTARPSAPRTSPRPVKPWGSPTSSGSTELQVGCRAA